VLRIIFLILQTICALGLIATVLLQSGKSAGLSGSIAGGSEVIFGKKKGVDELFAKITAYLAAFFLVLTLALTVL
jgi:preprotein translocase subunit SecG